MLTFLILQRFARQRLLLLLALEYWPSASISHCVGSGYWSPLACSVNIAQRTGLHALFYNTRQRKVSPVRHNAYSTIQSGETNVTTLHKAHSNTPIFLQTFTSNFFINSYTSNHSLHQDLINNSCSYSSGQGKHSWPDISYIPKTHSGNFDITLLKLSNLYNPVKLCTFTFSQSNYSPSQGPTSGFWYHCLWGYHFKESQKLLSISQLFFPFLCNMLWVPSEAQSQGTLVFWSIFNVINWLNCCPK